MDCSFMYGRLTATIPPTELLKEFDVMNSDPSYRGHLGEGTEGPRGRGKGG
jgi:hypothetical protein